MGRRAERRRRVSVVGSILVLGWVGVRWDVGAVADGLARARGAVGS